MKVRSVTAVLLSMAAFAVTAKEKVVFVSAHPDDSYGFAATASLLKDRYEVHVVDFTYGERGCGEEKFLSGWTKAKRIAEETSACRFLGAKLHWIGEVDGEAQASPRAVRRIVEILQELKPKAVFAHWPLDVHPDHVQCSAAVQKAMKSMPPGTEFYFFEEYFRQTMNWHPTYSVDISPLIDFKVKFLRHYACQNEEDYLVKYELEESAVRGRERVPACKHAETFATYDGKPYKGGVLESIKEAAAVGR